MASSCRAPKSVGVKSYVRAGRRKKPKPPDTYYECFRKGRGCGTHHRTYAGALRHAKQLDRAERRKSRAKGERLVLWDPEKRTNR
jgi:hypothetical protein